jgi:competence protein ComEC
LGDGITLTDLAPTQPPLRGDNNNAAVLRLDYGTTSVLLTADIERDAEERLVRRGANLRCTVLKVAHHGSKTSTTPLLLDAARPRAAIVSCGRYNKFGHPAADVLARLAQRRIPVYRTDRDGAIDVFSDGHQCWIHTFR